VIRYARAAENRKRGHVCPEQREQKHVLAEGAIGDEIVFARTLASAGGKNPNGENDRQIDENNDSWDHRVPVAGDFFSMSSNDLGQANFTSNHINADASSE